VLYIILFDYAVSAFGSVFDGIRAQMTTILGVIGLPQMEIT
jgi:hypothetical protein